MKKKLSILAASILATGLAGGAQAGLSFDPNGGLPGGALNVGAFDWAPTSFLALGGTSAITAFDNTGGACGGGVCDFDVLTHAKLVGIFDPNGNDITPAALNSSYEITMVARFKETVTGHAILPGIQDIATFAVKPAAGEFIEIFFDTNVNAVDISGFGFNDGDLILTGGLLAAGSTGLFGVDLTKAPVALDGSPNGNQYAGQSTVTGSGSQSNIASDLLVTDPAFFKNALTLFGLNFANISQGLPYISVDPSDCYTPAASGIAVAGGATVAVGACANVHVNGVMAVNPDGTGIVPAIGAINGFPIPGFPDFVAQTDFNSPVSAVPEPTSLGLLGLGLGVMGFFGARRRKTA